MTTTVTLNELQAHEPREAVWEELLKSLGKTEADETPVSLEHILDLAGIDDALWALRALPADMDNRARLLICDFARPALQYTYDTRPAEAIRVARDFAHGRASDADLAAAREKVEAELKDAHKTSHDAAMTAYNETDPTAKEAARKITSEASAIWERLNIAAQSVVSEKARHEVRDAAKTAAWSEARAKAKGGNPFTTVFEGIWSQQKKTFRAWLNANQTPTQPERLP